MFIARKITLDVAEAGSTIKVPVDFDLNSLREKLSVAIDTTYPIVPVEGHYSYNSIVNFTVADVTWVVDGQHWQSEIAIAEDGSVSLSGRYKVKPVFVAESGEVSGYVKDGGTPKRIELAIAESLSGNITQDDTDDKGWSWNVEILKSGLTKTANVPLDAYGYPGKTVKKLYGKTAVSESALLFDGAPFVFRSESEHVAKQNGKPQLEEQQKTLSKISGTFRNITVAETASGDSLIKGKLDLRRSPLGREVRKFLRDEVAAGKSIPYELSFTGQADAEVSIAESGEMVLEVRKILRVDSVDPALVGNAGGRILAVAESAANSNPVQKKTMDPKIRRLVFYSMLGMAVAEAGVEDASPSEALPADFKSWIIKYILKNLPAIAELESEEELAARDDEKLLALAAKAEKAAKGGEAEAGTEGTEKSVAESGVKPGTVRPAGQEAPPAWAQQLMQSNAQALIDAKLSASNLPPAGREHVVGILGKQFRNGAIAEAGAIDEAIRDTRKLMGGLGFTESLAVTRGENEGDKTRRAVASLMFSNLDTSTAFGKAVAESAKASMGFDVMDRNNQAFFSLRDMYLNVTGGTTLMGHGGFGQGAKGAVAEAASAGILTQLIQDAMHQRMVAEYVNNGEWNWYEKVSKAVSVTDFRAYHAQNYGYFIDPSQTITENDEYPETSLTGNEDTSLTLVERGGQFGIGWRVFVNDDVNFLINIAPRLANAKRKQLAKAVGTLFLNAFTTAWTPDSTNIISSGHANQGTTATANAISAANIRQLRNLFMLQTERGGGDVMGIKPKYIIHPVTQSEYVFPIVTRAAGQYNDVGTVEQMMQLEPIEVPNWGTTANGVFLVADPSQVEGVNILYLNGQKEPQIFQEVSETGFSFTHKRIRLRHEHHWSVGLVEWKGIAGTKLS
jgi:hypothetical protein